MRFKLPTGQRQVYIFEFKVIDGEQADSSALHQLQEKNYAAKYADSENRIFLIGMEFSKALKNIVGFDWYEMNVLTGVSLILFLLLITGAGLASADARLQTPALETGAYEVLEDASRQLTLAQAVGQYQQGKFHQHPGERLSFGRTRSAWWVHFTVTNPTDARWYLLLDSHLGDELDLYVLEETTAGLLQDHTSRYTEYLQSYPRPIWLTAFPPDQPLHVYLRATNGALMLSLPISLLDAKQFLQHNRQYTLRLATLYSFMLALALYQLIMYLSLREKSYLLLAASSITLMLNMHRSNPLFDGLRMLSDTSTWYYTFPLLMTLACSAWFIRHLLEVQRVRLLDVAFKSFILLALGLIPLAGLIPFQAAFMQMPLGTLYYLLVIGSALYLGVKGNRLALYLAGIHLFSILFIFSNWWNVMFSNENWVAQDDLRTAYANLMTLFMLAWLQAERVRQLRIRGQQHAAQQQAKDEFLAVMSHELRTPLHAITGVSSLLRLTPLNRQQADYLNRLQAAAQHQQQLIGNVLDIAKINNRALTLENRPFRLDLALRDINGLIAPQARQNNLEYRHPPLDTLEITLLGDRTRLTQVLLNLLTNAVKYTPEGRVELSITVTRSSATHCRVDFGVKDTGVGIAKADQRRLFDTFVQVEGKDGVGLGLAISQKLVTAMGGELQLESAPQQGSRFFFTLPFTIANVEADASPDVAAHIRQLPAGLRILLVDDSEINLFIGQEMLKNMGAEATTASGGEQAILLLQQQRFDLVLIDIGMPDIDGLEVTRWMRRHALSPNAVVIALSAHSLHNTSAETAAAGMNAFLSKPFEYDALYETIMKTLAKTAHTNLPDKPDDAA